MGDYPSSEIYKLDDLDTKDPKAVVSVISQLFSKHFSGASTEFLNNHVARAIDMFEGRYKDYQSMDTQYHDLEHTMQTILCWSRIMLHRQHLGIQPSLSPYDFETGFTAMLLHDVGYLKKKDDPIGTGAKFTLIHEQRSCEMTAGYLKEIGWPTERISSVKRLIKCTGPRANIPRIKFRSLLESIMGKAVCTADYIGQMSDPRYLKKLPELYMEFQESDEFQKIPESKRVFKSVNQLLEGTPNFWHDIVLPKLDEQCDSIYLFLSHPYPFGYNPYLEKIAENIATVNIMIDEGKFG